MNVYVNRVCVCVCEREGYESVRMREINRDFVLFWLTCTEVLAPSKVMSYCGNYFKI
jgi:hypothetical protein